ncbi:MAG TPA: hypothetical protein PKJ51_00365 [Methanothrix sp.]|nr:hypothetical protein [Methanothrix sp.]
MEEKKCEGVEITEGGFREISPETTLTSIEWGGGAGQRLSRTDQLLVLRWGNGAIELMESADIEPEALIRFTRGVEGAIRTAARLIDFALATWALLAAHPDAVFSLDENGGLSVQFAEAQEEGDDD